MAHFIHKSSRQSYYFKNKLCYTEDHIPVQTLYIFNIPLEVKKDELLTYFTNYGQVVSMHLSEQAKTRPLPKRASSKKSKKCQEQLLNGKWQVKTGWVYFAEQLDAAKVLHCRIHHINGQRFQVQASDSWHQPEALGASELQVDQPENADIFKLTDFCLSEIVQYLTLSEQMIYSRACQRFRGVYQQLTRSLHRSFDLSKLDGLTVWNMRDFFKMSGRYIQNIEGVMPATRCERLSDFFGAHCVNVKSMEITDSKLSQRNMAKMFANTTQLENLVLENCGLTDGCLLTLKNCKNLKKLSIAHNPKLNGYDLDRLPASIETLNLTACRGIQSARLVQACKILANLKDLNIIGVNTSYLSFYEYLSKRHLCRSLETLRLSLDHHSKHEEIAKLPNLNSIHIAILPGTSIRSKLMDDLITHKAQQLEQLAVYGSKNMTRKVLGEISQLIGLKKLILDRIDAINDDILNDFTKLTNLESISLRWCNHITDSGIFRLITGCPKLRELHLEDCEGISEKLVHTIIKKVQHQVLYKENERKLPIQFYVQGTKIEKSVETHPDVANTKNIIKLFFTSKIGMDLLDIHTISFLTLEDYDFNPNELEIGTDDEMDFVDDHRMFELGFLSESDLTDSDLDIDDLNLN